MKNRNPYSNLDPWLSTAEAVARLFQPHCEVLIHDLKSNTIAAIFNGFSKRKVGDGSLLEEDLQLTPEINVMGPYPRMNWDGRKLKSITAVLRDLNGNPIGLMCMNFDLSIFASVQDLISSFINQDNLKEKPKPLFQNDWREKINGYIDHFLKKNSKTLTSLTKEDQSKLVRHLHRDGAFAGKNSAQYIGQILGISRATVYNYLKN